jgi:hypothetical protein
VVRGVDVATVLSTYAARRRLSSHPFATTESELNKTTSAGAASANTLSALGADPTWPSRLK